MYKIAKPSSRFKRYAPSTSIPRSSSFTDAKLSGEVGDRHSSILDVSLCDEIISRPNSFLMYVSLATSTGVWPFSFGCRGLAPCFSRIDTNCKNNTKIQNQFKKKKKKIMYVLAFSLIICIVVFIIEKEYCTF